MANGSGQSTVLDRLRRTSAPAMDTNRIEFEDIRNFLVSLIGSREDLSAFLEADTTVFLIDAMAALGAYTQYAIDAAWLESNLHTAISPASVRAIVRTLGVRQQRKIPAHMQVRITQPTHRAALIPAYSVLHVDGNAYFTREAVRVFSVIDYPLAGLTDEEMQDIYGISTDDDAIYVALINKIAVYQRSDAKPVVTYVLPSWLNSDGSAVDRVLRGLIRCDGAKSVAIDVSSTDPQLISIATTTTISGSTADIINVVDADDFDVTPRPRIRIGDEEALISTVSGNAITLTAALSGGAPASGVAVSSIVKSAALHSDNTHPRDLAHDGQRFMVVDASGSIFEYDAAGAYVKTYSIEYLGIRYPQGIHADPHDAEDPKVLISTRDGDVWALNAAMTSAKRLYRLDPAPLSLSADNPLWAIADDGKIRIFDRDTGTPGRDDSRTFDITVYEGAIRTFRDTATQSANHANIVLPEGDFQVSDVDVFLSVDGNPVHVSNLPLWHHGPRSPIPDAVQDFTLSQGLCEIRFGTPLFGRFLSAGDTVDMLYAVTSGAGANGRDVLNKPATFSDALRSLLPNATGQVVTAIGGGRDEADADVYRIIAPHIFSAQNTATAERGYQAAAIDFDGVIDCLPIRQVDYAPDIVSYSNLVKLWLLADDPNRDGDDLVITDAYKAAFIKHLTRFGLATARYDVSNAIKKAITVIIHVTALSVGDRAAIERNIKHAVRSTVALLPNIIGKTVTRDDLSAAARNAHPSILGVSVTHPEHDVYHQFVLPSDSSATALATGQLPAATYEYYGTLVTRHGDEVGESRAFKIADVVLAAAGAVRIAMTRRFGDSIRVYRRVKGADTYAYVGDSVDTFLSKWAVDGHGTVLIDNGPSVQLQSIDPASGEITWQGSERPFSSNASDGDLLYDENASPPVLLGWSFISAPDADQSELYAIDRRTDIAASEVIGQVSAVTGGPGSFASTTIDGSLTSTTTVLHVLDPSGFKPGQRIEVDGDSAIIESVSDEDTTVTAAVSAATLINVADTSGFAAGQRIKIGSGNAVIQSIADGDTTVAADAARNTSVITVTDVTGFEVGHRISIGSEHHIIQSIDTGADEISISPAVLAADQASGTAVSAKAIISTAAITVAVGAAVAVNEITLTLATARLSAPGGGTRVKVSWLTAAIAHYDSSNSLLWAVNDSIAQLYSLDLDNGTPTASKGDAYALNAGESGTSAGLSKGDAANGSAALFGWLVNNDDNTARLYIIDPIGATAPTTELLSTETAAGSTATILQVDSAAGFEAEQIIQVGTGANIESAIIQSIAGNAITLTGTGLSAAPGADVAVKIESSPQSLAEGDWSDASMTWNGSQLFGRVVDNSKNEVHLYRIDRATGLLEAAGTPQNVGSGNWQGMGIEWDGTSLLGWVVDVQRADIDNIPQEGRTPAGVESSHVFYPSIADDDITVHIQTPAGA